MTLLKVITLMFDNSGTPKSPKMPKQKKSSEGEVTGTTEQKGADQGTIAVCEDGSGADVDKVAEDKGTVKLYISWLPPIVFCKVRTSGKN